MHSCLNIHHTCKFIYITDTTAKSLVSPLLILLFFSATSIPTSSRGIGHMDIVPYDQKWYPMNQNQKFTHRHIGKIRLVYKSAKLPKKFSVTLTETLVCWEIGIRWYKFTLYTRALSCSQFGFFQPIFKVFVRLVW